MSLLTATLDDVQPRGGKPLPKGKYRVTVESVKIEPNKKQTGTSFVRQYGNIRTPDGATELENGTGTFRIGNRKLFNRSWIDHSNPAAAEAGQREIKQEAIAAGLMPKPEKDQPSELPFESWEEYGVALTGRELLVVVDHETRRNTDGTVKKDEAGEPIVDAVVLGYLLP